MPLADDPDSNALPSTPAAPRGGYEPRPNRGARSGHPRKSVEPCHGARVTWRACYRDRSRRKPGASRDPGAPNVLTRRIVREQAVSQTGFDWVSGAAHWLGLESRIDGSLHPSRHPLQAELPDNFGIGAGFYPVVPLLLSAVSRLARLYHLCRGWTGVHGGLRHGCRVLCVPCIAGLVRGWLRRNLEPPAAPVSPQGCSPGADTSQSRLSGPGEDSRPSSSALSIASRSANANLPPGSRTPRPSRAFVSPGKPIRTLFFQIPL